MKGWLRRAWRGESLITDPRDDLAKLGDQYQELYRRTAQLEAASEGLAFRWRSANQGRLDAQVAQAAAERVAADLGSRLNRVRAVLAVDRLPPAERLAQVQQVLMEGEPEQASGGEPR